MIAHNIPSCYRKSKRSLLSLLTWRYCQPSLARTTRLELLCMIPKVFEPLKFDCITRYVQNSLSLYANSRVVTNVLSKRSVKF